MLNYDYVDDMLNKRTPHRPAHFKLAKEYIDKGQFILGGAHSDVKKATIIFRAPNESVVKTFAENDPYVKNGLVTST